MGFTLKTHLSQLLIFLSISGIQTLGAFSMENQSIGARSLALSHATVSLSGTWAAFHNQAGLAKLEKISAGFFYESKFGLKELSLTAGAVVLPVNQGTFGISFSQFGYKTYKEHKIGLAYSRRLSEIWSAAVQLDYLAKALPENARNYGFATFEGGLLLHPSEKLSLGAHVFNPLSGGIQTPVGKQQIPVIVRAGGLYRFGKSALVAFEVQKKSQAPTLIKTGIEFLPVKNLALRLGVSGKPFKYTSGIGYQTGKLTTDIGFGYHGNLGVTPSVSVQFQW